MNPFCRSQRAKGSWTGFTLVILSSILAARPAAQSLMVEPPRANGWVSVQSGTELPERVVTLLASTNLAGWLPIATLHQAPFRFVDLASAAIPSRFYLATNAPKTEADDWKNQVVLPDDPFLSSLSGLGQDQVRWIKFAIELNDPFRVYYQESGKYSFHYDFAAARLAAFKGMSREEFDRVSLHPTNQQVVLGAVLVPSGASIREYGIQFVGLEAYPAEWVAQMFDLVQSTVAAPEGTRAFYVPTYEQAAAAEAGRAFFERRGITVSSANRWLSSDTCYAPGWALGRLQFVPGTEIHAAYADGRLEPEDILLTDGVPAEVPFLAGIIALEPSTPNSHVAILAKTHGLPFVYLASAAERTRVQSLAGQPVLLRVTGAADWCQTKVVGLGEDLEPGLKAEILGLKAPPKIEIVPKASFGAISAPVDNLNPSDIKFFGGKAANFGVLRRSIPDSSPSAIAVSFDLWDTFLNQVMPSGKALRIEINERLSKYAYPPAMAAVRADLEAIRDLIRDDAVFTAAQQQELLAAVSKFPANTKIRFRSSTNVEDSERFSGAGLYDSYSGCPADDLDNDSSGPSLCDPDERNERGIFRAIKRVYASFYNDNAFLERLRLGVDESQVGMGVLVHLSTPDEIELANGVATLRIAGDSLQGELVTQAGAVSVTNPDGQAQPEVVTVSKFSFGTFFETRQRSSLVPLGGNVLLWEAEYRALFDLLTAAAQGYQGAVGKTNLTLDFEYKKIAPAPGKLSIKQVREVPMPPTGQPGAVYLLNEPGEYCVFQGEFGDVFANHRLKSRWFLETRNLLLTATNLSTSLYTNSSVEFLSGTNRVALTNGPASWPGARHRVEQSVTEDIWKDVLGADQRTWALQTDLNWGADSSAPLRTQTDLMKTVSIQYARPMPTLDFAGTAATTTSETVRLVPCPSVTSESLIQERTFTAGHVRIRTSFYWPKHPGGITVGYTAPLEGWVETRIEGLTTEPLVLGGEYSQTYRPEHHNFAEQFIFEPQLDAGVSAVQLAELRAANVQLIHVFWGEGAGRVTVLGLDEQFRQLP